MLADDVVFTGLEPAPHAFARCEQIANDRLTFIRSTLERPSDKPAYDLVLAIDVIEQVEDLYGFLRLLAQSAGRPSSTSRLT